MSTRDDAKEVLRVYAGTANNEKKYRFIAAMACNTMHVNVFLYKYQHRITKELLFLDSKANIFEFCKKYYRFFISTTK